MKLRSVLRKFKGFASDVCVPNLERIVILKQTVWIIKIWEFDWKSSNYTPFFICSDSILRVWNRCCSRSNATNYSHFRFID